jgi:hypothetical protein
MPTKRASADSKHFKGVSPAWTPPSGTRRIRWSRAWFHNAAQSARQIVRMIYDLMGSVAIFFERTPLDQLLRDAETFCQHIVGQHKTLEYAGALLLGSEGPLFPYI